MSSRNSHPKEGDGQPAPRRRVSPKTMMTRAYFYSGMPSKRGNRGMELAAGLSQVDGYTIANALVNEKELRRKMEELSKTNPEKGKRLKLAERVDKIANPFTVIPIAAAAGILGMHHPIVALTIAAVGLLSATLASIWASRVKLEEAPDKRGLEEAKEQLAEAADAKAELCAKAGLSERFVELLQELPLDVSQKHTVLKQAIFHESPEGYVQRVAGILGGILARGEDLEGFADRRLDYLPRDIFRARDLAEAGEKSASSGDNAQASALFADAARALEGVLDYAGAAEMYRKASDAVLVDKRKAAELCARAGDCYAKAGERAAAKGAYEWAAMIVRDSDPDLHSEFQGKAVALI